MNPQSTRDHTYLALFQRVTRMVTSTLDVDEVFGLILDEMAEVMGVDGVTIRLLDTDRKKLLLAAASGLSEEYLERGPVDDEKSVSMALAGKPVIIADAPDHPQVHYRDELRKEGVQSILAAPIVNQGEIMGVLRLLSKTRREFEPAEADFAAALAEQCGIATANARAYSRHVRQLTYFTALYELAKIVSSTRGLDQVLDAVVKRLPAVMQIKGCTMRLFDPTRRHLDLTAAHGLADEYLQRGSIDDEISTLRALQGEPVIMEDAVQDPRNQYPEATEREGVASILAAPIMVSGRILGVLRLLSAEKQSFGKAEINFSMAVAEQAGQAIQNARDAERMANLVTAMEQQEAFLQHVLDGMAAGLLVLDNDGRIMMVNARFLKDSGVEEPNLLGRKCTEIMPYLTSEECPVEEVKREKRAMVFNRLLERGGKTAHLELTLSPVTVHGGEAIDYVVVFIRDMTDRVQLAEEHAAREKLQGVLEMAGAAAHELNSPLFAALGRAQMLAEDLNEEDIPPAVLKAAAEDATVIEQNLKTMSKILSRMAGITRYESKDYDGDVKIVDIGKSSQDKDATGAKDT